MSFSRAFVTVFRVDVLGTAQSIPDTTWTTVLFDLTETDGSTLFYNTATGKFTAPISGWYDIESQITWSVDPGTAGAIRILKNGDPNSPIFVSFSEIVGTIRTRTRLAENETVEIQIYQNTGAPISIAATIDPGTEAEPGRATNALVTMIKAFANTPF